MKLHTYQRIRDLLDCMQHVQNQLAEYHANLDCLVGKQRLVGYINHFKQYTSQFEHWSKRSKEKVVKQVLNTWIHLGPSSNTPIWPDQKIQTQEASTDDMLSYASISELLFTRLLKQIYLSSTSLEVKELCRGLLHESKKRQPSSAKWDYSEVA